MDRPNYQLENDPAYTEEIPALLDSDQVSATNTFNPLFLKVLNNIKAVKLLLQTQMTEEILAGLAGKADKAEVAELVSDLAKIAFDLRMRELLNTERMEFVMVDMFDTPASLELLQGRYSSGKVFI